MDGIVINADSMQVLSRSASPHGDAPGTDRKAVPHLLYGHVSVREPYSTGRYQDDAKAALGRSATCGQASDLHRRHGALFLGAS
ncbi:MAG: hypothetical protein WDM89_10760 [Rhizomicrobium sp.]